MTASIMSKTSSQAPPVRSLLDLSEKVVIVTGGGSGVGRGVALRFAEAGARVVVHYHTSAAGAESVVAGYHREWWSARPPTRAI